MITSVWRPPVSPGELAPDFTLPTVNDAGTVSLADYRRKGLFLGLFPGLWCVYCRRAITEMATFRDKLNDLNVDLLGVVASRQENARLYLKYRPTSLRLAADPETSTHRAYGVLKPVADPEFMRSLETTRIDPEGALPEALPIPQATDAMRAIDGYTRNATDDAERQQQWPLLKGQVLIDRDGIVRWVKMECATEEGLAGLAKPLSPDEVLTAARCL
jgi:peroxiredoxin